MLAVYAGLCYLGSPGGKKALPGKPTIQLACALLLIAIAILSSPARAAEQRATCNGSVGNSSVGGDTIWNGSWTALNSGGWFEATDYMRDLSDGDVGQQGNSNPGGNPDYSDCWSLSPFTVANTDDGETCISDGPLFFTTGRTYYRTNIDRSGSPTVYCQLAMTTADSAPGRGNTQVVSLGSGVPVMPLWLLGLTAGLPSLFGLGKIRKG